MGPGGDAMSSQRPSNAVTCALSESCCEKIGDQDVGRGELPLPQCPKLTMEPPCSSEEVWPHLRRKFEAGRRRRKPLGM